MDLFSQRLRKQRERSWMQTRQLNKNASTVLRRQLKVMEQRQQHAARLLKREQEQIAEALDAFCHSKQHALGPPLEGGSADEEDEDEKETPEEATGNDVIGGADRTKRQKLLSLLRLSPPFHRRFALPPVWQTWKPGTVLGEKRDQNCGSGDSPSSSRQETWTEGSTPFFEAAWLSSWDPTNLSRPASFQTSPALSLPDQVHLYHHPHHHHHHSRHEGSGPDKDEGSKQCRYRAFSRHSPCRYFPCSEPHSYHNLVASQLHGHNIRRTSPAALAAQPSNSASASQGIVPSAIIPESESSTDPSGGHGFETNTAGVSTNTGPARHRRPQADVSCSLMTSSTAFSSSISAQGRALSASNQVRGPDGHIGPRTSIEERLRGLKQLVRELRDKNEAMRPKDWAVNYGQAVSRRLIRKPLVIGPSQA